MDDISLDLSGIEELQNCMERAISGYPDKIQKGLEKCGKELKNRTIKITYSAVDKKTGNLVKGYKVDPVKGYGIHMEVDFRATSPHFHLIENGHEIVLPRSRKGKVLKGGGKNVGFVPGRLIVKQSREEYKSVFPKRMEKVCEEILKGSDLN